MKELNFIVKPEKLEELKFILDKNGCSGLSVYTVMGCGAQRGYVGELVRAKRGAKTQLNLLPKIKVECIVDDEKVEAIIRDVREKIATGMQGDGKIFIKPVLDAVRIRTGERGDSAIR